MSDREEVADRTYHCGECNRHIMMRTVEDTPDHSCLNCGFENWQRGENIAR